MKLIVVDRAHFKLHVYRWRRLHGRWQIVVSYPVTIGRIGFTTPGGPYRIGDRSRTPDWRAPEWAEPDIAGKLFRFDDPQNPFAGGFISLVGHPHSSADGVGFHGTKFPPLVGTRDSHGCVRLETPDLLDLYDRCRKGTAVYID